MCICHVAPAQRELEAHKCTLHFLKRKRDKTTQSEDMMHDRQKPRRLQSEVRRGGHTCTKTNQVSVRVRATEREREREHIRMQ